MSSCHNVVEGIAEALAAKPVSSTAVVEAVAEGAAKEDAVAKPVSSTADVESAEPMPKPVSSTADVEEVEPMPKRQKEQAAEDGDEPLSKQQEDEPMPKRQKKPAAGDGDEPVVKLTAGQLKSMKIAELHVTAAKLKVKRPRDHKKNDLIILILEKMEALPDTDKFGHVLSLLTKGKATSVSDLAKSG